MWEIFQLHICEIEKVLHWLISLTQCSVCRRNKPIIYTYVSVWIHVVGILRGKACASATRLLLLGLAENVARICSGGNCQQLPCKDNRFCLFVTNKQTNAASAWRIWRRSSFLRFTDPQQEKSSNIPFSGTGKSSWRSFRWEQGDHQVSSTTANYLGNAFNRPFSNSHGWIQSNR